MEGDLGFRGVRGVDRPQIRLQMCMIDTMRAGVSHSSPRKPSPSGQ